MRPRPAAVTHRRARFASAARPCAAGRIELCRPELRRAGLQGTGTGAGIYAPAASAAATMTALPAGPFDVILADPPWSYYGSPTKDQAAGKHYRCLTPAELAALPVRELAAPRAVLFCWATGPKLAEAADLLRAWRFRYVGVAFVWVKTRADGTPIAGQGIRPTLVKPTTEFRPGGGDDPARSAVAAVHRGDGQGRAGATGTAQCEACGAN